MIHKMRQSIMDQNSWVMNHDQNERTIFFLDRTDNGPNETEFAGG